MLGKTDCPFPPPAKLNLTSKLFAFSLVASMFAPAALSEGRTTDHQAKVDQLKACIETALENGTPTAEQIDQYCHTEKAAVEERLPGLADHMRYMLLNRH